VLKKDIHEKCTKNKENPGVYVRKNQMNFFVTCSNMNTSAIQDIIE